jgi:hypothetical protein
MYVTDVPGYIYIHTQTRQTLRRREEDNQPEKRMAEEEKVGERMLVCVVSAELLTPPSSSATFTCMIYRSKTLASLLWIVKVASKTYFSRLFISPFFFFFFFFPLHFYFISFFRPARPPFMWNTSCRYGLLLLLMADWLAT